MARRGPPPKPTAVRKAQGTLGRGASARNKREAKPTTKLPAPPPQLSDDAREVWQRLGEQLLENGLMTSLDEPAFAALCDGYAAFLRLTEQARTLGGDIVKVNGQLVPNPARARADKEFEKVRKLLAEFGMSPASRSRVESSGSTEPTSGAGGGIGDFLGGPGRMRLAQ